LATVTGSARSTLAFNLTGTGWLAGVAQTVAPPTAPSDTFSAGTAANMADLIYATTLTLSATPTTLDLTSLTDPLGVAVAFARIRGLYIRNNATTDGWNLTIGLAASNAWAGASQFLAASSSIILGPSSSFPNAGRLEVWAPNTTGYVVDGTHKSLKLDPGANTFTIDIQLIGASV
jgi:hypothetical protein